MDDTKKTTDIRVGQRGPAVLKLRRKPVDVRAGTTAEKVVSDSPRQAASLKLATLSIPA